MAKSASPIDLVELAEVPVGRRAFECVERKGRGHPDSICDAVMEAAAVALAREYLAQAGRLLHFNLDKALLVAGQTTPKLGGGFVRQPMRLIFGDRATAEFPGGRIDPGEVVESAARDWFARSLRFVEPERHLVFQNELRPGSAELADIFAREEIVANDTSAAVGYAPLSETETLALAAETWLNSPQGNELFPEAGEDVKVMGVRRGRQLDLTVAAAFVDRLVPNQRAYFERKAALADALQTRLQAQAATLDRITVAVNTLDDPARGEDGMYLTVLGTSAEGGDCGEVGRGNPASGVISLSRPVSNEAAAGKNPVSHVGKIYNLLSYQIAQRLHREVEPVAEAYVWLCSQIGRPVSDPWFVSVGVALETGCAVRDIEGPIQELLREELSEIPELTERLVRGELSVC